MNILKSLRFQFISERTRVKTKILFYKYRSDGYRHSKDARKSEEKIGFPQTGITRRRYLCLYYSSDDGEAEGKAISQGPVPKLRRVHQEDLGHFTS